MTTKTNDDMIQVENGLPMDRATLAPKIDEGRKLDESRFPNTLIAARHHRVVYAHVLPAEIDWRDALEPAYWSRVMFKLRPGDRIEVRSADWHLQFEILIFDVSERVEPVLLDMGFRAIWPPNLELPPPVVRESKYFIKQVGSEYRLLDLRGTTIGSYPHRRAAGDMMALLEREARVEATPPPAAA
jgi:hypothetical protein